MEDDCRFICDVGILARSSVIVGKEVEVVMVGLEAMNWSNLELYELLVFMASMLVEVEPERSMVAADAVVDAMAVAAIGSGWL